MWKELNQLNLWHEGEWQRQDLQCRAVQRASSRQLSMINSYIYIYMHAHMHSWGCLTVDAPMGVCMCGLFVLLCMLYILFVNSRTSWSSALDEHASWCGSPFPIFLKQSRKNLVDLVCISNICWSVLHAHDSILYISCQEFFQIFPYFCSSKKPMSTLDDV